ncbi:MAG TPA: DUF6421 family protein, partial [Solirubrobacteraceae bacterium]
MPRVLFDEAHSEAWTIRPELAREIQPSHPEDSSYAKAADALRARDFSVTAGSLADLGDADVLVIAHPSDPKWERTVPGGEPRFSDDELDAIERWVDNGGGLVVLGEEEQDKYGSNLNDLLARFGVTIANDAVQDYAHHHSAPSWVLAELAPDRNLLARVDAACFYRAGTLALSNGARPLARTHPTASTPQAPLLAVTDHGAGRVVVAADSDLFGDDCIDALSHRELWANLVYWAAGHAFATAPPSTPSPAAADPAWAQLKEATEALRALQAPDGSVPAEHAAAREHVATMIATIERLAPHFAHQSEYLRLVVEDLRRWDPSGVPDFGPSLNAFRPDLAREDGIEHLVVFPMYKQNGSRDKVFEALIVRVPWPDWLAELERTRYDNAKFVPVTFVDNTSGYDSECAVLFPETVTTAEPVPNHFGGIFCDREAER